MQRFLVVFLILSFNVSAATPPKESFDQLNAGMPDFVFYDPEGNATRLADYRGKVVLVKLWATWCGVCRAKWPDYQALYDAVKDESQVRIVTLSVFEDPRLSQDWVTQQGFDVPLYKNLVTDRGAVQVSDGSFYFIKGTPMMFLIDKDGVLRKKAVGAKSSISEDDIRNLI